MHDSRRFQHYKHIRMLLYLGSIILASLGGVLLHSDFIADNLVDLRSIFRKTEPVDGMKMMAIDVQLSSDESIKAATLRKGRVDLKEWEYDHLKCFSETLITTSKSIDGLHRAIRGMDIPRVCKESIIAKLGRDQLMIDCTEYDAGSARNGGVGYKYDLQFRFDDDAYQLILIIGGRSFSIKSEVSYREESIPVKMRVKRVSKGYFSDSTYYEDEVHYQKQQKKVVTPIGISEEQFDALITMTYNQEYLITAAPQLKRITEEKV